MNATVSIITGAKAEGAGTLGVGDIHSAFDAVLTIVTTAGERRGAE